ncbi:dihydroxyacetone kinase-like protein [Clostridium pascui]|uniref:dihydroxyacetone kinase subunit DhaK n=1 Tax=Clostridium pascui TaxID=46609 RepID=UPI00195ED9E3|nr:dihydroxyacetone kinase subunit DhaK [Clostridium pascui]MBM7871210.1 dihydroxyacetone kinase-like protein [Clostridium pascui]
MKKLINNSEQVVEEMINGMVAAHSKDIKRIDGENIIIRYNIIGNEKVSLVSGGGSGHEPAHAGYVGYGMLDAAVCGSVFTSPTPDKVYEAIKAVKSDKGVLLIIKNYSGDVMNFEMAKDMAEMEGIKVESVIVDDDVAVENSTYTIGKRGIAGTVFVHKIAGAKAEEGASLKEVKNIAKKVIKNLGSMGVALTSCIVPEVKKPTFTLKDDEMEIGVGIHGEPGIYRETLKTSDKITEELLHKILGNLKVSLGEEVAVMINGLGATPLMELYIVNNKVQKILNEKGINIYKTYVGEFMTSLEMAGCSITLLKLDDELKKLLDAPANTVAFK